MSVDLKVWSFSGYRGDEKPVRIELNGKVHYVEEILDGNWDLESLAGH